MKLKGQDLAALRQLPEKELEAQLKETEAKLYKLKFANAIAPLKNGHEISHMRKHRARLLTWIRQKTGGRLTSGVREKRLEGAVRA